jgi:hypothetical protein
MTHSITTYLDEIEARTDRALHEVCYHRPMCSGPLMHRTAELCELRADTRALIAIVRRYEEALDWRETVGFSDCKCCLSSAKVANNARADVAAIIGKAGKS